MDTKSLIAKKAEKEGCQVWRPRDCFVELIRQIDSGETRPTRCLVIAMTESQEGSEDGITVETWYANVNTTERVAALAAALQRETEVYRGRG